MITLKSAFMVPAVVSGLWMARGVPVGNDVAYAATQNVSDRVSERPMQRNIKTVEEVTSAQLAREAAAPDHDAVTSRRVRVERLLVTLDRIAEVSMQMGPDQSAWIEPVLVDLAEQTLDLSSEDAIHDRDTDSSLGQIEGTVDKLVKAVSRMVEPEMSL